MLSNKKSTEVAKDQMSPEAILDLLPEINPEALGYLKAIRLHGTAFENSVYGDYLEKSGAITAISQRKNGGSCKYKLSDAANEWFDFHPEHDPQVKIAKYANDQTVTKEPRRFHNDPKPAQTTTPADYKTPTIEGPVRCVLFDSVGVPIRFGIIRGSNESTYKVELPAEGRTASVLRQMISTESSSALPFWLVIPDTSAAFAAEPEFESYLTEKGIDADELIASDPNLEKADLPLPKVIERPFERDNVAIGEVVYLAVENDLRCGIFMGLNEKKTQGALWMVSSDAQSNVLIDSLETKWMVIDPSDAPLVFNGSLSEELLERLHARSLELKENPIDPFPPPPPPKEEEPEPDPEGTIREVYIPRSQPLPVGEEALGELQESRLAEAKAEPLVREQKVRAPQNRPPSAVIDRGKKEALVDEWIRETLLPLIIEARSTGNWLKLGSKGWEDMSEIVTSVCMQYSKRPNRWYETLSAVTIREEYKSAIGGKITEDEIELIKEQIEKKRRKDISEAKKVYTQDAAREFVAVEIPNLIAEARKTSIYESLSPGVLRSSHRIRELIKLSSPDGSGAVMPFLRRLEFGLSERELLLIEGKEESDQDFKISHEAFLDILNGKFLPLLRKCRENSDFRPLERENLGKDADFSEMIKYVTGSPHHYRDFYKDSRIPLTEFEVSLLIARDFSPSRREEILAEEILPLIAECRRTEDYSPLKGKTFSSKRNNLQVIQYLLQGNSLDVRKFLSHPRIGLSQDEIAKTFGDYTESDIQKIRNEKWEPLLERCRRTNDFSLLMTNKLVANDELRALMTHHGFPRQRNVKEILVQELGVTEEEVSSIKRLTYTYDHRRELVSERIYPIVLSALESGDFSALEFRRFFEDTEILGIANVLLKKRPSVEKLLRHPEVGLTDDEARILVRANVGNKLREERELLRSPLAKKVRELINGSLKDSFN